MKTIKLSTRYSSTIRLKGKTYVIFLHTPSEIWIMGWEVSTKNPLKLQFANNEEETEMEYTDEFFWNAIKEYKKKSKAS